MSAGMADIIAAHPLWQGQMGDVSAAECQCGQNHGAFSAFGGTAAVLDFGAIHAAHVANELTRAGYGDVQEAKAEALTDAAEEFGAGTWNDVYMIADVQDDADAARATAEWLRERAAALTPDPLAAALSDPEGHALVQAIHDKKAEG